MTRSMNRFQAAFVIARRDYAATVLSRTFLFFLLGPLFPLAIAGLFAGIGANVGSRELPQLAVIAAPADFARLASAREQLEGIPGVGGFPQLVPAAPGTDPRALLAARDRPVVAVLVRPFDNPRLIGAVERNGSMSGQVRLMIARASPAAAPLPDIAVERVAGASGAVESARATTARAGQALLFFLTLLLSGMLLSQFIEEKSNKVIEILAAAVPVETVFLGKLFAMMTVSLTGIAVWTSSGLAAALLLVPSERLMSLPAPAVGWPFFLFLGCAYFAMSYLLTGAAFLGIGAQANSAREVQTLSMPVTMSQVALFAIASAAVTNPYGASGLFAAAFPLSSPYAMMARAAMDPAILPHLAALAWQMLWLALILKLAAAWFRRSVLSGKSGRKGWWKRKAAKA
ncbi:ABC transporter permease [Sphingomonas sp. LHG3406-1]|uniref:ABC transporter permease n=1 Tax=Sphingomonas sp. LHG3406-1 TaxID=2804617 RepID=UPI00260F9FCE|nr:ABC transporter permease [Sphingomonas sp. LHG3406-1]